MPKGVITRQAALRVWSERANLLALVVHPKSYLDLDEEAAYERLHPFRPIRRGADYASLAVADLEDVRESSSRSRSSFPCGAPASACRPRRS